ncbi:amidase family protein [Nocardia callitridis]|uniref:amidase n=1 Tax=Nocardia callitridis TaxID=648753 RepID=A0ABP9K088_9NOCA
MPDEDTAFVHGSAETRFTAHRPRATTASGSALESNPGLPAGESETPTCDAAAAEHTRGPVASIAAGVRDGTSDPVRVLERTLAAVAEDGRKPHGLGVVRVNRARAAATETALRPDLDALPLAGVPIAVEPKAEPGGSVFDDVASQVLRAAGAVLVEVATVPEADDGIGVRTARRSVARGLFPVAYGDPGLDSYRTGMVGGVFAMTPGADLVSRYAGAARGHSVLSATVGDAAMVLSVLAGKANLAEVDPPGRLRIGLAVNPPSRFFRVDRRWTSAAYAAGAASAAAGHRVERVDLPADDALLPVLVRWTGLSSSEVEAADEDAGSFRNFAERLELRVRCRRVVDDFLRHATDAPPGGVDRAEARLFELFERYDVVIAPVSAPVRAEIPLSHSTFRFTPEAPMWRAAGWPSATVPMRDSRGAAFPIATHAQLAGPPGSESTVLRLAAQLAAPVRS